MIKSLHHEFFRPIAVPVVYIQILKGDAEAAILLSQLLYWSDKTRNPEGWIYKSYQDWYREIGFSDNKTRRAASALEKLGFIEVVLKRANCAPTLHYRVKVPEFTAALEAFIADQLTPTLQNSDPAQAVLSNSMLIQDLVPEQTLTETTVQETTLKYSDEIFSDDSDSGSEEIATPGSLPVSGPPFLDISCEPSRDIPGNLSPSVELPIAAQSAPDMIADMCAPQTIADVRPPADDSDPGEVMRWFREMDAVKEKTPAPRRSAEEVKKGVEDAVVRSIELRNDTVGEMMRSGFTEINAKNILEFVNDLPEHLQPLGKQFCILFGRSPLKKEKSGWIAEFKIMYDLGIRPGDLVEAFRELTKAQMTIKGPMSVQANAEKYSKMRNSNGLLPGEKRFARRVYATDGAQKYLTGLEKPGA